MITTSPRGLRQEILPYRLFQKAKKLGVWDPNDIDFSQDVLDWAELTNRQRERTLRLIAQFQAGEEAVTLDLLPLIMVIAKQGRLEEELYLTTFLFEEAKHTEFFRLLLNALDIHEDLSHLHTSTYRTIFYEILPETMQRLVHDDSPEAIADAAVVYNMFIEGVLAETGYWSFYNSLARAGKMPGLMRGIDYLKRDESRHIGYGTFLLQRLICERPELYTRVETKLNELAPFAMALNQEGLSDLDMDDPLAVNPTELMEFSAKQLSLRLEKLARAKNRSLDELYRVPEETLGVL
jgi:ribonucleoside-diphosphate reductase beta chain